MIPRLIFGSLTTKVIMWLLVFFVGYIGIASIRDWIGEKWKSSQINIIHKKELKAVIDRSQKEINKLKHESELLQISLKVKEESNRWATKRIEQNKKTKTQLKRDNTNLDKILKTRIPSELVY